VLTVILRIYSFLLLRITHTGGTFPSLIRSQVKVENFNYIYYDYKHFRIKIFVFDLNIFCLLFLLGFGLLSLFFVLRSCIPVLTS
jgi:hypothetical protein